MLKWSVIILALAGLAMGVWTVATSGRENPEPPPASSPSVNPFPAGIAAEGLVEAAGRNVELAPPEPGLVRQVHVAVGDRVEADAALFQLDARPLEAELMEAKASLAVAKAQLARAEAAPRSASVPPLEAAVEQARARLKLAETEFQQTRQAYEQDAATERELERQEAELASAEAALAEAKARLAELEAGTWEPELTVARRQLRQAEARIEALNQRIDRLTVRAPSAGTVLKRHIEPGEYAQPGGGGEPAMVLGRLETLHVRAMVDEEDVPRLAEGAAGVARVRGPGSGEVPLTMLRIEPLAEPKQQLTGAPAELVDTRVIEVLFRVEEPGQAPLYPGMLVDVFIEGPPEG